MQNDSQDNLEEIRKANGEKYTLEYYKKRDKERAEKARGYYLQKKYNTTDEEYKHMFNIQGGACAICKTTTFKKMLAVDHDHATGKNRGLLCVRCNVGLGYFMDNEDVLHAAADYVSVFKQVHASIPIV